MSDIFISHAAADKRLVDELVDLLQTGVDLRTEDICCTSVDGMGIDTGQEFVQWIRDHLLKSRLIILLLTPNYYHSRFCVAEMGAAWASDIDVFPIVLPDMPRDPGAVLLGRQTAKLDQQGLDELRDRIGQIISSASERTGRWNLKKDGFLKRIADIIADLPLPDLVERKQLDEEKEKVAAGLELEAERVARIRALERTIGELKQLKDRESVEAWEIEHQSLDDRWTSLTDELGKMVRGLDRVMRRALYSKVALSPWYPGPRTSEVYGTEIRAAIDRQWIREIGNGALEANDRHPRIEEIVNKCYELESFINEEMDSESAERLEDDLELPLSLQNREFWEEVLLKGEELLD